jgi:hypothetical protein
MAVSPIEELSGIVISCHPPVSLPNTKTIYCNDTTFKELSNESKIVEFGPKLANQVLYCIRSMHDLG